MPSVYESSETINQKTRAILRFIMFTEKLQNAGRMIIDHSMILIGFVP